MQGYFVLAPIQQLILSEFGFNSTLWWASNILARGCRNVCVFVDQKDLLENFKTVVEVWRRFSVREPFYLFQTMVSKEKVAELSCCFQFSIYSI